MSEIPLCLPKGESLAPVADIFGAIAFPIEGYRADNRTYRPVVPQFEQVRAKIFAEKDVVIQVAVGNYAIGFCGLDWIEEYVTKFPHSGVQILRRLGRNLKKLYACCHKSIDVSSLDGFCKSHKIVRIISEYPNLAENFAIQKGMKRFKVFPAWGSVEAYPPEHAEVVILAVTDENIIDSYDLKPLELILDSELCIILNQKEYEQRDLSLVLNYFSHIT